MNRDRSGETRARALKGMAKAIASAVVVGSLLFTSAGRLDWIMAWVYIGLSLIGIVVSGVIADPELLAERSGVGQGPQGLDVVLAVVMARLGPAGITLVAGLNLRFRWQPGISPGIQGVGVLVTVLGYVRRVRYRLMPGVW